MLDQNRDPHHCLVGPACRSATTNQDGERHPAVTTDPDTICDPCLRHIQSCTHQLPKDWRQLRNALGERAAGGREFVRSTPTPAIPISITKERLMVEIVELADCAAAIVSDLLHTDQPDGRRTAPPQIRYNAETFTIEEGSPADIAEEHARPDRYRRLTAAIALVEPHIDKLATTRVNTAVIVWRNPHRCPTHTDTITEAETNLAAELRMPEADNATPKEIKAFLRQHFRPRRNAPKLQLTEPAEQAMQQLRQAFATAAACDDCNGWDPQLGQSRDITDITGIDIALALVDIHNRIRAELGKTRLRHRYAMPCPRCAGRVGRDDGTTVANCDSCGASWTEREYKFLAGLVVDERKEMDIIKWLLAEGYTRLDQIQDLVDELAGDKRINVPGSAVAMLLDELKKLMTGHPKPADREAATDKAAAEQRQVDEDTWTWKNETPYQPPKRQRPKPKPRNDIPRIAASSLSTINEDPTYLPDANDRSHKACRQCNIVHPPGDCIA